MTPAIENITGGGAAPSAAERAADAWRRINDKPSSIVLVRNANSASQTTLAAQTLRVEYNDMSSVSGEIGGAGGASSQRSATLFGIRSHATLPDTDIRRDDRFRHDGMQFRVMDVIYTLGEIQARAEVLS